MFQELVVGCDNSAEGKYFKVKYSTTQYIVLYPQKSAISPSVERELENLYRVLSKKKPQQI